MFEFNKKIARLFHVHDWITDDNTKIKIGNWYNKPIYKVTKKCKCGKERVATIIDC